MYNYIWQIREKILKLYLIELYEKYQNILSLSENNFLDEDILSIIDPNYKLIIEKLKLIKCKLNKDQDNIIYQKQYIVHIQTGGNMNFTKQQYINHINILQQKLYILANNNVYLTQQLQQCNLDKKILEIEKSSMADKLIFFDKSLDTVAQSISNNISNGDNRLNTLSEILKDRDTTTNEHVVRIVNVRE